jgi:hypothetical protein
MKPPGKIASKSFISAFIKTVMLLLVVTDICTFYTGSGLASVFSFEQISSARNSTEHIGDNGEQEEVQAPVQPISEYQPVSFFQISCFSASEIIANSGGENNILIRYPEMATPPPRIYS